MGMSVEILCDGSTRVEDGDFILNDDDQCHKEIIF